MFTKRLIVVLLVGIAIPIIGYLISFWILGDMNRDLAKSNLPSMEVICSNQRALQDSGIAGACAEFDSITLLGNASIWAGVLGVLIPLISLFGSFI